MTMYIVKHTSTNSIFSIQPKFKEKASLCFFPNNNHAKRVADNIAHFRYCQNTFPKLSEYDNLFKHSRDLYYENDFTPFNKDVSADWYNLSIEPVHDISFLSYCQAANLDVVFCILCEKSSNKELIFMPVQEMENKSNYLNKCINLA